MKKADNQFLRWKRDHQIAAEEGDKIKRGWDWGCNAQPIYFPNHKKK